MKKVKLIEVVVTYCDVCGSEIGGNMSIYNYGTKNEKHACQQFYDEDNRCDYKLREKLFPRGAHVLE